LRAYNDRATRVMLLSFHMRLPWQAFGPRREQRRSSFR
jgi:hypothetical protein